VNIYGIVYREISILGENVTIIRRTESLNQNGRAQSTGLMVHNHWAIIIPQSPGDLMRQPDYSLMRRTIEINTTFPLQGSAPNLLADHVYWHSNLYVVLDLRDISKFGVGFVNALAQVVEDPWPPEIGRILREQGQAQPRPMS